MNPSSAPLPPAAEDRLRKVYLEITTECDLDCKMCIRRVWDEPDRRMTSATFQGLLEGLRAIPSLAVVNFSGFGEPTRHPQCLEFLRQVKAAGLRAELVTNGLSLDRASAAELVDLKLDKLTVSVDGVESNPQQAWHGDGVERVQASLREVYRARLIRRAALPEVGVAFVATRSNVHQLPDLKRLALELGFSRILVTNLVPYAPELRDEILYRNWTTARGDRRPSPWNPTVDLPRMDARSEAAAVVDRLCLSGTHVRVGGADVSGGGMDCRFVGEGCLAVGADGTASPCLPLMYDHSYYFRGERRRIDACRFGNVNDSPPGQIWQNVAYRAFRERVRKFVFSPCIDCGGCELRESNGEDCFGNGFPCCGECLWAAGLVRCP